MKTSQQLLIVSDLREAFDELSLTRTGADIGKMAMAIGGARHAIASALETLGDPRPMRELNASLKAWHESLSNSTAPIDPAAVMESANAADPLSGARGMPPPSVCTDGGASDLAFEIGYDG